MVNMQRGLTARIIREGAGEESVFIAEYGFYCYLMSVGNPAPVLQVILQKVAESVKDESFGSALEFEDVLNEALDRAGAPEDASVSAVFNQKGKLFVVTENQGEIYIQRGGKTMKLLDGTRHASGALQDEDVFILTTSASSGALESVGGWSAYMQGSDICGHDISGLVLTTSVVEVEEERTERRASTVPKEIPEEKNEKKPWRPAVLASIMSMDRRRLLMVGGIGLIGILLMVSLVFGFIRRANDKRLKQIAYTKDEVTQKLQQADDVAFLNSGRAAGLINDAKQDIAKLEGEVGESKETKELKDLIAAKEATIFKKEEKQPEEFFDLGIEDKNARGKLMARFEDRVAIVNPDGTVYILNLEKKSLDKRSSGVKNALAVAVGEASVFVVGNNGIVQVDEEGKAKKIIDKDWSRFSGIASFNNNIYVLDGGKGVINKYTPTDGGYGGKTSYVQGSGPNINGATSIAIDSSVYVSREKSIVKYSSGLQEGFNPQFPEGGISIKKIESAEDVEKVYVWDETRGLIFIISKNGSYERQIKSDALKKADDIVVTKDAAYILQGQKIYKVGTD